MYNDKLPKRKQIRLKNFDYSSNNAYFITICTHNRKNMLSHIRRGDSCGRPKNELTELGEIAYNTISKIKDMFDVTIDCFVIMPNHIHFVIFIEKRATARVAPTIGRIVGTYKSLVLKEFREICNNKNEIMGKIWQRSFFDHIIRNEQEYYEIWKYIELNPDKWIYSKMHI